MGYILRFLGIEQELMGCILRFIDLEQELIGMQSEIQDEHNIL